MMFSSDRHWRSSIRVFFSPLVVNQYLGVLTGFEIIAAFLFLLFLAWTFYARISNDFNKMIKLESFKLERWQYKLFRAATRCGLLAEACLALLLLPVLRGLSVFQLLGIQFEASIRYHTWLGTMMVLFATLHGTGTLFIWGIKYQIKDQIVKWQNEGRIYLAGEITLITGLVILITSLPQIRRKRFETFYYTHHLYILFFVFFLFHGGDRHFYMVFPGIFLFALDKLLRVIHSRPQSYILSANLFPCEATELVLPKDPGLNYTPGSVVFINVPSISRFQWHSFSVTSSCGADDHTMSVLIKGKGWWTNTLHDLLMRSELRVGADQREYIPFSIEGPYGPPTMDFSRYDSLLLVAGGIGITPFLSMLQEIACNQSRGRCKFPTRVQLVYTVKKFQDLSLLTPILPPALEQKELNLKLKLFVTQEKHHKTAIKELETEQPQIQNINFDLKDAIYATYGLESLPCMAAILGFSSIAFLIFLCIFNHVFLPIPAKKDPKQTKNPSSIVDLLLLLSFLISITCGALAVRNRVFYGAT